MRGVSLVSGGVGYAGQEERLATLDAGAATAAMFLAPLVTRIGKGEIDTGSRPAGGNLRL